MGDGPGRPLKFETIEDLQEKINEYFHECDPHWVDVEILVYPKKTVSIGKKMALEDDYEKEPELKLIRQISKQVPYTVTGLALALDTTRETLLDYEDKDGYSDTIKRAKLKCQNFTELSLYSNAPTGPIFSLKNNYGWKDQSQVNNVNTHSIKFNDMEDDELDRAIEARKNRTA